MTVADVHRWACCCSSSASPASIGLHELGHLVPAKLFGVKVTQYFVGFGTHHLVAPRAARPSTASRRSRSAATSSWSACCRPARSSDPTQVPQRPTPACSRQLIADARAAEYELVEPGDEDRLFYRLPWWKKVVDHGVRA